MSIEEARRARFAKYSWQRAMLVGLPLLAAGILFGLVGSYVLAITIDEGTVPFALEVLRSPLLVLAGVIALGAGAMCLLMASVRFRLERSERVTDPRF